MFINFTNHPSAQWSAEQKAAALAYGEVIDLAFPAIDPAADEAALDSLASAYAARILHMNPDAGRVYLCLPGRPAAGRSRHPGICCLLFP